MLSCSANGISAICSFLTKNITTRLVRTYRCTRTRRSRGPFRLSGARWRCQFWADSTINISERRFPTGTGSLSPPVGGEPQSITEDNAAAARSRAFPRGRRDLGGKPNEYDDGSSSIGHSGTRPSFPSAYPVSLSRSMITNPPQISGRYVGQITRFCCPLIICDQPLR